MSRKTFTKSQLKEIFEKNKEYKPGANTQMRYDFKGRLMYWDAYGKRELKYGWNVDHINRNIKDNNIKNLRPVNFKTHEELNEKFNKKINLKLSVFEIALMGILLSVAITSKYFDKFILHVHPFHIVSLIVGISLLRTFPAFLFVGSYILISSLMFGVEGPTLIASVIHTLESAALLIVCFTKLFKNKKQYLYIVALVGFILLACSLYLFLMILGDSEYTSKIVPFWERVRLALIYPGDWLNVTASAGFAVAITPVIYLIIDPRIVSRLANKY